MFTNRKEYVNSPVYNNVITAIRNDNLKELANLVTFYKLTDFNQCDASDSEVHEAIINRKRNIFNYLCMMNFYYDHKALHIAIKHNVGKKFISLIIKKLMNSEKMSYMAGKNMNIGQYACMVAASYNNVQVLFDLRCDGYDWSEATPWICCYYGHVECLRYALYKNCPINKEKCLFESENGYDACMILDGNVMTNIKNKMSAYLECYKLVLQSM